MPGASWAIGSFLGGEISAFAQGRFDKPDYRYSMKTCLNSFPVEAGAWVRRPGTKHGGHTRRGAPGRVVRFDFEQASPVTLEFTDGYLRARNGTTLITTNDQQPVVAISAANPAVVQLAGAVTWATGDTVMFPGASTPLLENRQFTMTVVDTTHISLADALSGATIDGSTLGALAAGTTVARVMELTTSYASGAWAAIRPVQAETTDILLTSTVAPQAVTVTTQPSTGVNAAFALAACVFNDGPYLDPFTNGVQATPSAVSGVISLTLSFPQWVGSAAYAKGSFVTQAGINYISIADQNVGNPPNLAVSKWQQASVSAAINGGNGFLATDIGRLVRLLSEPPQWSNASTYSQGALVSYNPSGQPGASTYWISLINSNNSHIPGTDLTSWSILTSGAATWSWGKIVSLTNIISNLIPGGLLGNMNPSPAFDGNFSKSAAVSSNIGVSGGATPMGTAIILPGYVGRQFGTPQVIEHAAIYPSVDAGFCVASYSVAGSPTAMVPQLTFNLRAKQTVPGSSGDGVLLGSIGPIGNSFAALAIISNDQTTAWNFVWIEMISSSTIGAAASAYIVTNAIAQISFFNPPGTGTGSGVNVEILGAPLPYTNTIRTWRLGVYSDTTGWPTCGVYNDGRLYLGGAVGNRFDACVSNGINGGTINFAPTDLYGVVSDASAISATFNSDGVNPILWMKPDLQGVLMGTQAGEWLIQAPTAGPISPTNISARNVTHHGSANVQPCSTEHTTVFVQRFAKKLLEYFPDVYSGKFSAPNLADKAAHIVRAGIAELAYTSAVTPIVWGRDALGALFGITYKRDTLSTSSGPTFAAWHRHTLGSGRVVESISAGPSTGGSLDSLSMVTNDAATNVRHVEVLTDVQDELAPVALAWFLDNAVIPTSKVNNGTSLTINGLWHLNGKTVQIFAGGLDLGDPGEGNAYSDFVVTNGSVTIPYGDAISVGAGRGLFTAAFVATNPQIVVGFTYTSDGQTIRPMLQADTGARNGPAFAKLSRGHRYGLKLVNTLGLSVGGDLTKTLYPCGFKKEDGVTNLDPLTSFTGVHQDSLRDDYGYEGGSPAWRSTRPFPANIVIVGSNLSTQDQ